jgi:hypothetical protein
MPPSTAGLWFPEQRVTVVEALRAYTADAAWAVFEEKEKGTLSPGKLADFVILSEDPFSISADELSEVKVVVTVVGGRVFYRR